MSTWILFLSLQFNMCFIGMTIITMYSSLSLSSLSLYLSLSLCSLFLSLFLLSLFSLSLFSLSLSLFSLSLSLLSSLLSLSISSLYFSLSGPGSRLPLTVPSTESYWIMPTVKPFGASLGRASHKAVVQEKVMWVVGGYIFNYSNFQMVLK